MTEWGMQEWDRRGARRWIGGALLPAMIVFAVIVFGLVSGSATAADDEPIGFPLPKIEFPEMEYEWEKRLQGDIVTHRFKVRNVGNAPLKILRVRSNCGCTTPSHSETIAPGEEGHIDLRVNTGETAAGYVRKNATVFSNDPTQGEVMLWIKGQVDPILKISEPVLKLSGIYRETKTAKFEFQPGTASVTKVVSGRLEEDKVEIVSVETREGGGGFVTLRAPEFEKPELIRDSLILKVQLDDGEPVDALFPIVIEHLDTIRMTPTGNLVFYRRQTAHLERNPDREVSKEITLRSARLDLPLHVKSARIEGAPEGLFSTEVKTVLPGQQYIIKIRVLRTHNEAQVAGQLVIETEDPVTPIRKKDVFAQFRMRPPQGNP